MKSWEFRTRELSLILTLSLAILPTKRRCSSWVCRKVCSSSLPCGTSDRFKWLRNFWTYSVDLMARFWIRKDPWLSYPSSLAWESRMVMMLRRMPTLAGTFASSARYNFFLRVSALWARAKLFCSTRLQMERIICRRFHHVPWSSSSHQILGRRSNALRRSTQRCR